MTSDKKRWLHYGLTGAAIVCSLASGFALFVLGATRWTASFNALAIVLILLAVKSRQPPTPR